MLESNYQAPPSQASTHSCSESIGKLLTLSGPFLICEIGILAYLTKEATPVKLMAQSLDHNKRSLIWAISTLAERGLHKWMKVTKLPFLDREQGSIGDDHK